MSSSEPSVTDIPIPLRFERLTARHAERVAPFDCGNEKISNWLREEALPAMETGKYTTYVAIEEETGKKNIVGYIAVRSAFIEYPPRRKGSYRHIVPVAEIAYLGRDRHWKHRQIGVRLAIQGLLAVLEAQDALGGLAGVQLTRTDKARHLYTSHPLLFEPHPAANSDADYYKPMQDVRLLVRVDS